MSNIGHGAEFMKQEELKARAKEAGKGIMGVLIEAVCLLCSNYGNCKEYKKEHGKEYQCPRLAKAQADIMALMPNDKEIVILMENLLVSQHLDQAVLINNYGAQSRVFRKGLIGLIKQCLEGKG